MIVGIAGAEYGIRGFVDAYDAATGKRAFRFNTIPEPGDPHFGTWEGESWKTGRGSTWTTGSYDPNLNLTYWGTGNPGPDWNDDHLFTDSMVAIDVDTGKLKWYFQYTPPARCDRARKSSRPHQGDVLGVSGCKPLRLDLASDLGQNKIPRGL